MSLDAAPSTLGADLRALRRTRGLTLAAVAKELGKSLGWLSQVERGLSEATLPDLRSMAELYGVPLTLLLGQNAGPAAEQGRIVRAENRRQIGDTESGLIEELLSPDLTDEFEVIHSTFQPGAGLAKAKSRPTQEIGYLISGHLTLWLSGEQFDLRPGDAFRIREESYRWENTQTEPAVAIWVIAPPVY